MSIHQHFRKQKYPYINILEQKYIYPTILGEEFKRFMEQSSIFLTKFHSKMWLYLQKRSKEC